MPLEVRWSNSSSLLFSVLRSGLRIWREGEREEGGEKEGGKERGKEKGGREVNKGREEREEGLHSCCNGTPITSQARIHT